MLGALGRRSRSRIKRAPPPPPEASPTLAPAEPFVNRGLQRWNLERAAWTAKPEGFVAKSEPPPQDEELDADDIYAELMSPRYNALPRRVPLGELIDILQDVREHQLMRPTNPPC